MMLEVPRRTILQGDCLNLMRTLPDGCVHMVVTSPPYWGLRDYGIPGRVWGGLQDCDHCFDPKRAPGGSGSDKSFRRDRQAGRMRGGHQPGFCRCGAWFGVLGLEPTPELFVQHIVEVFREVRRILRDDGTLWLNLGDSYATGAGKVGDAPGGGSQGRAFRDKYWGKHGDIGLPQMTQPNRLPIPGLKPKDLVGIPWRVALALQQDGWYLRSDIIWAKPNPMPESVTDRPTKAHEYLFLLAKSPRYYFDAEAVKEVALQPFGEPLLTAQHKRGVLQGLASSRLGTNQGDSTRNRRSVWTIATAPYSEAHFATFPPKLIEPCILAGTSERGVCPECGAPWERVIERNKAAYVPCGGHYQTEHIQQSKGKTRSQAGGMPVDRVETTGWQPTCAHDLAPRPAIVFDPFGGSGTTAQVARALGRDWLLCELNPAYVTLAEKRIRTPLYGDAAKQPDSMEGQRELFPTETST